jgi:hypothetical protein
VPDEAAGVIDAQLADRDADQVVHGTRSGWGVVEDHEPSAVRMDVACVKDVDLGTLDCRDLNAAPDGTLPGNSQAVSGLRSALTSPSVAMSESVDRWACTSSREGHRP